MKVRLLPSAVADLDEIDICIAEIFGPATATKTAADLFKTFELLADFPRMGRPRPDVTHQPVRFFLKKPYWIVYQPGATLFIHRIYHAARDFHRIEQK